MRYRDDLSACRKLFVGGAGFETKVPEKGRKTDKGLQSWPMLSGISPRELLDHVRQEDDGVMDVQWTAMQSCVGVGRQPTTQVLVFDSATSRFRLVLSSRRSRFVTLNNSVPLCCNSAQLLRMTTVD